MRKRQSGHVLALSLLARRWCWCRCCPRGGGAGAGIDPFATVALKKNLTRLTWQTGLWQSSVFGAFAIGNLFFVRPAPAPPTYSRVVFPVGDPPTIRKPFRTRRGNQKPWNRKPSRLRFWDYRNGDIPDFSLLSLCTRMCATPCACAPRHAAREPQLQVQPSHAPRHAHADTMDRWPHWCAASASRSPWAPPA